MRIRDTQRSVKICPELWGGLISQVHYYVMNRPRDWSRCVLNSRVVPISQVVLKTGFTVFSSKNNITATENCSAVTRHHCRSDEVARQYGEESYPRTAHPTPWCCRQAGVAGSQGLTPTTWRLWVGGSALLSGLVLLPLLLEYWKDESVKLLLYIYILKVGKRKEERKTEGERDH